MQMKRAFFIQIQGLVQGVGFRPFIFRIANQLDLKGWVSNTNQSVEIMVEGMKNNIDHFLEQLQQNPPVPSIIENINKEEKSVQDFKNFQIKASQDISDKITLVSPDIAVCDDCLNDLKNQKNRYNYPLINCTHCGPRFSIVEDLPYDRKKTTMKDFALCPGCEKEYNDINDRRFHAQPVACNNCGPKYGYAGKNTEDKSIANIIDSLSSQIDKGKVLAIKGTGGYHLACDAMNKHAVDRLRKIKKREKKPFAVMFKDYSTINKWYKISDTEKKLLSSWQRPIVLIKGENDRIAKGVCMGFKQIGAMLPYMPFHHLLFEKLKTPVIVLTSGNFSEEPIITDDKIAFSSFSGITDDIIFYNREIHNRVDDSVAMVINESPRLMRRSRGYAPSPTTMLSEVEGILATGAELVNTFCIGKGKRAIISQHIGDLKNFETFNFYKETIDKYQKLFRFQPKIIVCDKHPDYFSTEYAKQLGIKTFEVQHHHAHIAACMAENKTDKKVIGFSFDGTGYGDDGHIWGSEVMICDLKSYERMYHLEYMPLPGGDKSIEEPWRTAVAYLYKTYGKEFNKLNLPLFQNIDIKKINSIVEMMLTGNQTGR